MQQPIYSVAQVAAAVALLTLHTATALTCYDCLSLSHSWCVDAAERNGVTGHLFDEFPCPEDEHFCSVLIGTANGQELVARQCSPGPGAQDEVRRLLETSLGKRVNIERYEVCAYDRCNSGAVRDRPEVINHPNYRNRNLHDRYDDEYAGERIHCHGNRCYSSAVTQQPPSVAVLFLLFLLSFAVFARLR